MNGGEGLLSFPHPLVEKILATDGCYQRESHCLWGMWQILGVPHLRGWPHTYAYGINTKWLQEANNKLIIISWDGNRLLGFKDNWSKVMGWIRSKYIVYTYDTFKE